MAPSELHRRNNKAWGINWKFLWHKSVCKKQKTKNENVIQDEIILLQFRTPVAHVPPELYLSWFYIVKFHFLFVKPSNPVDFKRLNPGLRGYELPFRMFEVYYFQRKVL